MGGLFEGLARFSDTLNREDIFPNRSADRRTEKGSSKYLWTPYMYGMVREKRKNLIWPFWCHAIDSLIPLLFLLFFLPPFFDV